MLAHCGPRDVTLRHTHSPQRTPADPICGHRPPASPWIPREPRQGWDSDSVLRAVYVNALRQWLWLWPMGGPSILFGHLSPIQRWHGVCLTCSSPT